MDSEPEDGAGLLDELRAALTRYVVMPSEAATVAVVLWIAATCAIHCWAHATRLVIKSPEKRCGKSRLLDVIEATCWSPLATANATVAAIFRSLDGDRPPTLLFDEADTIFGTKMKAEQNEDLRGLLNAGFGRGRPALRTVGPQHAVMKFETFAMVALAGIGAMPDTIEDRAVVITMRRRAAGEQVSPYRARKDRPALEAIGSRVAAWVETAAEDLADAEPDLPVEDRAADVWEPLVAIADAAGGHWPALARSAALVLTGEGQDADTDRSLGAMLLGDVRDVFHQSNDTFITSTALVDKLRQLEDSPWRDFELSTRKLAARLRPYGVTPGHNTAGTERGYKATEFTDAFTRYLPSESVRPSKPPETKGSALTVQNLLTVRSVRPNRTVRPDPSKDGPSDDLTPTNDQYPGTNCTECQHRYVFSSGPCPEHRVAG